MRLTKTTNYAIRILIYCAKNDGRLSQIPEIAETYGVSQAFLFKILQRITKAGLITTVRGRRGGLRLNRSAAEIDLLEVLLATEYDFQIARCSDRRGESNCPLSDDCLLHSALHEALDAFLTILRQHSIADLIAGGSETGMFCWPGLIDPGLAIAN
jgi:Rrf2 family iron-responsive transcriptional regulator